MKTSYLLILIVLLSSSLLQAQHQGNYSQFTQDISRQNILTSGNAQIYNPVIQQQLQNTLQPSAVLSIDVKELNTKN